MEPFNVIGRFGPFRLPYCGVIELSVGIGLSTVNDAPDGLAPPPGVGLTTVMVAVPAGVTREPGTTALRFSSIELYVVARLVEFQYTTEVGSRFVPLTVILRPALRSPLVGEILDTVGTGLSTVKVNVPLVP